MLLGTTATAQDWLHVRGSQTVGSHAVETVDNVTFNGRNSLTDMTVTLADGSSVTYNADDVRTVDLGYTVPEIRINTDDPTIYDVVDKINYLPSKITVKSNGYPGMNDLDGVAFNVRGRGNSTMGYPKKPYRLKFDKKTELSSEMKKAKNYALIANYIDNTLMRNTTAFMMARLLEMPYTNHSIPCNVYFNDRYVGSYMLTEKVGLNAGHMDDIDETTGMFWEMDTYYDENYKYRSEVYRLPMMVKDPDFDELTEDGAIADPQAYLAEWAEDWNRVERVLSKKQDGNIWDLVDLNSLVNYLLVYNVTNNAEISHPKSNYIHKRALGTEEKYHFGSVWDFDWAYTYYDRGEGTGLYNNNVFDGDRRTSLGSVFYRALIQTPGFAEAYQERWNYFKSTVYPQLLEQMDAYADVLEPSALANWEIWPFSLSNQDPNKNKFRNGYDNLKNWLQMRVNYLDTAPNFGFFAKGDNPGTDPTPGDDTEPNLSGLNNLNNEALSISFNDIHPGDGTGIAGICDDDVTTYYHSYYRNNMVHDPVYGSYVDWHFQSGIRNIAFRVGARESDNKGAPDVVDVYGSNDGKTWTKLHTFTDMLSRLSEGGKTANFGIINADQTYTYIRFAVIKSKKGDLTNTDGNTQNRNYTYWNASTLHLYGE